MAEIQEIDDYSEFLDLKNEGKLKEDVLYLIKGYVPMEEEEPSYHKVSYEQALDGMKTEYPTGKELDTFLEYKRDKKEVNDGPNISV